MYEIEISHEGLHKYRKIRGKERYVVQQKAEMQIRQWDEQWERVLEKQKKEKEKQIKLKEKEDNLKHAEELTASAQELLQSIENTLLYTLDVDDKINWDSLKDTSPFSEKQPKKPELKKLPLEPTQSDLKYQPKLNIIEKILPSLKQKKLNALNSLFEEDYQVWKSTIEEIEDYNLSQEKDYQNLLDSWEKRKEEYKEKQEENNRLIDEFKGNYFSGDVQAIVEYCDMVLANSNYPDTFPQQFELEYIEITKTLIVEYQLPSISELPTLRDVKYIQTKNEFKESHLTEAALNKLFDSLIYQIILRTIHEIFEADAINAINSVILNGWVHSIDKATGKESNVCIATIQTTKDVFNDINLGNVDPKSCFKKIKGVASTKLHSLTAIAPILQISREDKRFVSSYNVTEQIDDSVNLASMDWLDFEHLIRELFEKEFNTSGGEVKITRASKDGGVDAIAFDPDPIRGGKIVIQAKRYTNVVGLSAVRDLYGTVLNEGANKGILVTTADYGPEAYEFIKDKPLALLNGNNLLYLLEKHGHRAKIDLIEAKSNLK